jgi:hypothetical protein
MRELQVLAVPVVGVLAVPVVGLVLLALLASCGTAPTRASPRSGGSGSPAAAPEPRAQLAAHVAAAKDRRYMVGYTLVTPARPVRSVRVTVAEDGTWRVDVQGGALGGAADIAIAGRPDGQYQCTLTATASCVKVAAPGKKLPAAVDPRVHYPFTTWLDVLLDRKVPLSVAAIEPLPGATGACFAVDPAVTALRPPLDAGVFCYADEGVLTAARLPFGVLTMVGRPMPAPPTVVLPGPVTAGAPLPTAAPPPPPPPPPSLQPSHRAST